ncbi:MAG: cytochrome C oxidase [Gemmatimonas sp. SG8_38_2]|nr:MAG: cytochrome C oxidase [Gemmatimonas sp. SG8_38_2]
MAIAATVGEHHDEQSFIRRYIFSTDHKIIGIQFLFTSLVFLLVGGVMALLIRWQLAYPGQAVPGGDPVSPKFYNSLVTMHGTVMVFFAVMPLLVGVYSNYLIPLKLGAPDMAFPRLNMLSFWIFVSAGIVAMASLWVEGGAAGAGWTAYPPLSGAPRYSGVSLGQQMWIISVLLFGASSLLGSVNYITTVINMRAPGMTLFRMPLSIWSLFITAILALLAVPVLAAAVIMLLFDQTLGTTFFLPADGGQPLLWQHLFWFFGHPEVYILILPAMGIVSDIIANGSRKPVFGYHSMVYAIITIAFLGWIVWGHHMFQSGMNPLLGTTFMISTMAIAIPSAIKVFNWLGTIWRGNIRFHTPMLFAVGFVALFTVGGLSGIFMASSSVDIFIHDTYFIVAHIHYVLFGGSLMAAFAAIYFWFPKMFGKMMNEKWGAIHFLLTFISYNLAFFPMHLLGMGGHMRRIADPTMYEFLQPLQPLNRFITISVFLLFVAQLPFVVNLFWSLFRGKKAPLNPWDDNGLEWTVPSPAPHGNFAVTPTVYRGPYEFSNPLVEEDYWPQNAPPNGREGKAATIGAES